MAFKHTPGVGGGGIYRRWDVGLKWLTLYGWLTQNILYTCIQQYTYICMHCTHMHIAMCVCGVSNINMLGSNLVKLFVWCIL